MSDRLATSNEVRSHEDAARAADDRFLRYALRGNAAFSTLSGAAAMGWAAPLAAWMGVSAPDLLQSLGVNLLAFAGCLVWLSSRAEVSVRLAWAVVAADLAWVLGTVPLVLSDWLSGPGNWLAVGVADAVLLFAVLQVVGLRRMAVGASGRRAMR